jgi:hypothetical protein
MEGRPMEGRDRPAIMGGRVGSWEGREAFVIGPSASPMVSRSLSRGAAAGSWPRKGMAARAGVILTAALGAQELP